MPPSRSSVGEEPLAYPSERGGTSPQSRRENVWATMAKGERDGDLSRLQRDGIAPEVWRDVKVAVPIPGACGETFRA